MEAAHSLRDLVFASGGVCGTIRVEPAQKRVLIVLVILDCERSVGLLEDLCRERVPWQIGRDCINMR